MLVTRDVRVGGRPPDPPGIATSASTELVFDDFYHAHFRGLVVQLTAYTGDRGQAQELVQEAFCRAYARWDRLAAYQDPLAWVRRVAWNLGHNRWRRLRTAQLWLLRQRETHVAEPSPDRVALDAALAKLPPKQRRAVVLHYLADLTVAEIAAQEQVAEGTVKSWLHRGRTALATHLRDTNEEVRDV
ncbi:SigE family RNA polymerase sigma factor [Micromonospora noduli]|uniref:ECF RNA polymerase sigma factor SigE n=1 Tax=Micromonospora noduli TaxID=709876 RepID=A0A328N1K9_9ACTN|nr:SigE family RNA polymerase sigma factor [Micromonospora noduli]RAN99596.1 ECF RNA polymerase sigma factor SigE [Micromonospora noduli]RAO11757.1 ECF RNA polymerase sigma factor SigE [Micromonospora noduli]RAO11877.1 ECF RNA polymerase sigma factor SigE [Micromonospora noduli]RAO21568.1 ECF RNA polymerase sigma factor SigE [Micromonospora noduli]